jgi:hypothetical protein
MAFYGLFSKKTNKEVCYIARNESDLEKIKQTLIIDFYNVKEITREQFYGLKYASLIIDQDNSTEENIIWIVNNPMILNQQSLNNEIEPILNRLSKLSENKDYPFLTEVENYKDILFEVFLKKAQYYTYPINSSLEKKLALDATYEDTILSPLQLP